MKRHLVGLLILSLLSTILFLVSIASASETDTYGNGEYALTKYNILIEVSENNSFTITEKIRAHFLVPKRGIIRDIPVMNEVTRLDGSKTRIKATLQVLDVDEQYSLGRSFGSRTIKIGDPDRTLTGDKDYSIMYLYDLGKDKNQDFDEFYFNLIGTDWDTTISNVSFTIEMPKEFDQAKLGFSAGPKGSTDSSRVDYEVIGTTITGNYRGVLQPGEALTVRLELPEGYFASGFEPHIFGVRLIELLFFMIPVIFAALTASLWFKYGKQEPLVSTVEFYPPPGFNSAEVGLLWKGGAVKKDVISLLIYLANEGYLRIEETVKKGIFRKRETFKIVKVKEYDGKNPHEQKFLEGLFATSTQPGEVTLGDLQNRFYVTLNAIVENLNKQKSVQVFEKMNRKARFLPLLFISVTYLAIIAKNVTFLDYWLVLSGVLALFSILGFAFMFRIVFGVYSRREKFLALFWGTIFGGFPLFGVLSLAWEDGIDAFIVVLWGVFWICVMLVFVKLMRKRTALGQEILGKIKGFRKFLQTAEKPRLEALVQENPTYFYDILPFTYVLNVSDKWIKKFEAITLPPPEWHTGTYQFNNRNFGRFINTTMSSAQAAMISTPSSSSGSGGSSGGSGGGSSGGGSGGGGGSSW